jgi:hypothetical protein
MALVLLLLQSASPEPSSISMCRILPLQGSPGKALTERCQIVSPPPIPLLLIAFQRSPRQTRTPVVEVVKMIQPVTITTADANALAAAGASLAVAASPTSAIGLITLAEVVLPIIWCQKLQLLLRPSRHQLLLLLLLLLMIHEHGHKVL